MLYLAVMGNWQSDKDKVTHFVSKVSCTIHNFQHFFRSGIILKLVSEMRIPCIWSYKTANIVYRLTIKFIHLKHHKFQLKTHFDTTRRHPTNALDQTKDSHRRSERLCESLVWSDHAPYLPFMSKLMNMCEYFGEKLSRFKEVRLYIMKHV